MKRKIVADSSSNMYTLDGVDYTTAALVITTDEKEYKDDANLDVRQMVDDLRAYKGRSRTACPGVGEWIDAFGDADEVFCSTITSNLSGSYNAAMTAKEQYEEEHPGRKVFVLDSYSTGPEMKLHIAKMKELILAGLDYETICGKLKEYTKTTALQFCLENMHNLANNGRVNAAVAAITGMLGIRVIGDATGGVLNPTDKVRGEKKATACLVKNILAAGYKGSKMFIDHCFNEKAALALKEALLKEFPKADIHIEATYGLCSFYAEEGGLIIGYEIA